MSNHLRSIMAVDHVIQVLEGGCIIEPIQCVHAPEVCVSTDEDGQIRGSDEREMIESVDSQGWSLLTGFTGQYGYSGPIMHPSEFIGGGLAEHIMSTPGFYCAVTVECEDSEEPAGWAVAYREKI